MERQKKVVTSLDEKRVAVSYDGDLMIAAGKSRFEKVWQNKTVRWSRLLGMLRDSQGTRETHAEYMKMPKAEQDRLKDIGGFVGGHLKEGKRKNGYVAGRQVVTLDADFAPPDLMQELRDAFFENACAIYSTHKHCAAKPRVRLIIPLDREVTPDEYEAIARKVADDINIEYFDDSTYQAARLMYWPSHSADVEPVFDYIDGPFLCADDVLAEYPDWTDISYWSMSSRAVELRRPSGPAADPLTKNNLVGIFCRTYTVTEAIRKFLPDVYLPTDKGDRWTYAAGSTAAGLVVYNDDRFAWSNHATDPAAGQSCNAFDLVRIHLFGELDEGSEEKPMNRRASWAAMAELMNQDTDCIHTRDEEAAADFAQETGDEGDWKTKLIRNAQMQITPALVNATRILENDADLRGIKYNEMSCRIETEDLPWSSGAAMWSDVHVACLADWIARKYAVEFPSVKLRMAVDRVSFSRRYHPVRDYLSSLPAWDGRPRLDRLLVDYLLADDDIYVREVTRKTLVAAVARVYEPGCKFDQMLVLVGPQGAGKSSLFNSLAGKWFSDSLKMDMMNRIKEAGEQVQNKWIVEVGEMSGMKKADVETVKSFVSRRSDDYRDAFGHYANDHPRNCIIVGSTNAEEGFLRDVTGNRRFWPVRIRKEGRARTVNMPKEIVDQIWAEAKILYDTGEDLELSAEAEAKAADAQREAMEPDERQGIVEEFLDRLLPEGWGEMDMNTRLMFLESGEPGTVRRTEVSNIEIWVEALHGNATRMEPKDSYAIAKIMAKIPGWARTSVRRRVTDYGLQRLYKRAN